MHVSEPEETESQTCSERRYVEYHELTQKEADIASVHVVVVVAQQQRLRNSALFHSQPYLSRIPETHKKNKEESVSTEIKSPLLNSSPILIGNTIDLQQWHQKLDVIRF